MNLIGLERSKVKPLVGKLNDLLSCYMVFYQNARGFHWNIKGENFFELYSKYEELYNNLLKKVDEVAKRIITLGEIPLHSCDDYRIVSRIKAVKNISEAGEGVQSVLKSLATLLQRQREIYKLAVELGDEGTADLMSNFIREQEKEVWIYASFLNNQDYANN